MVTFVTAIEISGLAGKLLLLLPLLVLLAVILRQRRPQTPQNKSRTESAALRAIGDGSVQSEVAISEQAVAASSEPRPEHPAAIDWNARIQAAEAAGDKGALAGLYLSLAKDEIAHGRTSTAADHLRTSVRHAAKPRNPAIIAEARLELAELARAAGDLTTACEHWQIARSLFRELAKKSDLDETERLMQRHGCPTDWVLNDF
ncbi:hypothetical protein [Hyphomicrobium sp.]|uniref:hypothetical protein n=1 Tax=Hyphomicrobium sp. TaxID=82 RepID=UPI002E351E88|nr:hypothetical protein [Hyphomicrobium sp.]HEX2843360.1 hypothetical protein [Hyphomicrobium sp.]